MKTVGSQPCPPNKKIKIKDDLAAAGEPVGLLQELVPVLQHHVGIVGTVVVVYLLAY